MVELGETLVREVMTPRPDIVALDEEATLDELRALFREQEYSRFPVHRENLDNIIGVIVVKDLIQELEGRLELHFLPPYAPDLNPDEFVWGYMKTNGVSKKPLRKNESLKERVQSDLDTLKANRKLVRSFFGADSVAYASD